MGRLEYATKTAMYLVYLVLALLSLSWVLKMELFDVAKAILKIGTALLAIFVIIGSLVLAFSNFVNFLTDTSDQKWWNVIEGKK